MKPTPGPWRATKAGASVKAESGEVAYMARRQTGETERAANANLIAAARNAAREINPENPIAAAEAMPEIMAALLDAAEQMESDAKKLYYSVHGQKLAEQAKRYRATIAKATRK